MKDEFKETKFYKNGFVFINKKVENDPKIFLEYKEPFIKNKHNFRLKTHSTAKSAIFDVQMITQVDIHTKIYRPFFWDKIILKKAVNKIPFYRFDSIKRYFPSVNSVDEFISKKLAEIEVDVTGLEKDIKNLLPKDKLNICLSFLTVISEEIHLTFGDYRGTKTFRREPIPKVFRNKKTMIAKFGCSS